jgi:hypothetical protein
MKGMNFMFEDKDYIKNIVGMRDDDAIVIPLYIQIYGQKYSLLELDTIKKRFSRSAFKVGYATADALFMNNSFPVNRIGEFDLINTFTEYDESMERQIRYTVFESGDVDVKEDDKLGEEIHMYFECLFNNVRERVDAHFKSLIEQESIPLIPKEKPEKEEVPLQVGIKEYTGELSEYSSSWDPKFVNEETTEDPLEELRKEVAEYSQDDEDNNLLIVKTDNTGTEIVSATKATLDLPKDDYLSEGIDMGDGQVDILGNEVIEENNTDYSTDFDVF